MADDRLEYFEAAMGAISRITSETSDLAGARCPKCGASEFAKISDLFPEAVGRLEEHPDTANVVREGGLTDAQIVSRFRPPRRKSAAGRVIAVAIPLAAGAYFVYRRFGETAGELAGIAAGVVAIIVLMTTIRRLSDEYYHGRRRWNSLAMCRRCGQLVAP